MPSAAVQGYVETMEILIVADRDARGLHQDQPKERVTLLRDLAEMVRISADAWRAGAKPT